MTTSKLHVVRRRRALVAASALVLSAAAVASAARAAESIGTVVLTPGGSQTATGTVAQSGQAGACINGQRSAAGPETENGAQVNSGACAAGSGGQAGASAQQGDGTAQSAGATTRAAASTSTSTSAAGARGLRIARIQYFTNGVTVTKRFRLLVTVRDLGGRRVRNAIVTVGPLAGARHTVRSTTSTFSDRNGQAGVILAASAPMLGQRLLLTITARTPRARATRVGTLLLPTTLPR